MVHMALLFGATWMVNSIVFFAILTMILLSNLYVLAVRPRRLWPYYALLAGRASASTASIPMDDFLALPGVSKVVVSCAVVFLPVFFAGRDLRDGVSLEHAARRRFRLQYRRHHPGRPERKPLADPRVQSSALGRDGLLCAVGARCVPGDRMRLEKGLIVLGAMPPCRQWSYQTGVSRLTGTMLWRLWPFLHRFLLAKPGVVDGPGPSRP